MNLAEIESNLLETETDVLISPEELIKKSRSIILYNDDVNTFDFVIESLIDICKHEVLQAEQCAYIVHYSGKCAVKSDSFEKLTPLCSELLRRGLTAEIE